MTLAATLYAIGAGLLALVGVRSIAVLRSAAAPWTSAGWAASTAYCAYAVARLISHAVPPAPWHAEYVLLALMTAAFVIAGVRREPQAQPWWWPSRAVV